MLPALALREHVSSSFAGNGPRPSACGRGPALPAGPGPR